MNVLVTGATGFVGRHVVAALLAHGHSVVALARNAGRAQAMPWRDRVTFVACDLHATTGWPEGVTIPDVLVHLAWPGLPNYRDTFHLTDNLPADLRFLGAAVRAGVPRLVVAGTCLEYGLQSGALEEDFDTRPTTFYGLAKDTLRRALEILQRTQPQPFALQWVRLFYMHGEGQNPNSLLAQLDRLIDAGGTAFDMSPGDQLRDYLPITQVAENFATLVDHPSCNGVINCSSGHPISVRALVERRCAERGARVVLNRGVYPVPDYEPFAFWGVPRKLGEIAHDPTIPS